MRQHTELAAACNLEQDILRRFPAEQQLSGGWHLAPQPTVRITKSRGVSKAPLQDVCAERLGIPDLVNATCYIFHQRV